MMINLYSIGTYGVKHDNSVSSFMEHLTYGNHITTSDVKAVIDTLIVSYYTTTTTMMMMMMKPLNYFLAEQPLVPVFQMPAGDPGTRCGGYRQPGGVLHGNQRLHHHLRDLRHPLL